MPYQSALTIVAPVARAPSTISRACSRRWATASRTAPCSTSARSRTSTSRGLIVARRGRRQLAASALPASLILLSDFDVPVDDAPRRARGRLPGAASTALFGHCEGYPTGEPTRHDRLAFLRAPRREGGRRRYVNTIGRTAPSRSGRRRSFARRSKTFLDDASRDLEGAIRSRCAARVSASSSSDEPALAWARRAGRAPGARLRACASWRTWSRSRSCCLLLLAAGARSAAPVYALLLRRHERRGPGAAREARRGARAGAGARSRTTSSRTRSRRSATSSRAAFGA